MVADPNTYRGYQIDVEMKDGQFYPSIHDPLIHQRDSWVQLSTLLCDSKEEAEEKAHRHIDDLITKQVEYAVGEIEKRYKKKLR